MKFGLKIKSEDCSLIGLEILKYIEEHQISLRELARQAKLSHPGLRRIILKGGNLSEDNIKKLAHIMGRHPLELSQLVYEDRLREMADPDAFEVARRVFDDIFEALSEFTGQLPQDKRPSEYMLLKTTFNTMKSFQE